MQIRAVFLDVANTLLYKPALYPTIRKVLSEHGLTVEPRDILVAHRFLSEVVSFPDRTSREFYQEFNSHLIRAFGGVPKAELVDALFEACTCIPWAVFPDVSHLEKIEIPLGILSNWDSSLENRLSAVGGTEFRWVLGSAEQGVRKPDSAFFHRICQATGLAPKDILYIGDSMRLDIEPALNLGLKAVLIDRDRLYPHAIVSRIEDLGEIVAWLGETPPLSR
jgi:FMN phosphatase YigB (HAD superfamily)